MQFLADLLPDRLNPVHHVATMQVTEFYPHVPWASKYNTIPCAAGHHIHEGRWLRDPQIMADYLKFWFWGGGSPEFYTFWVATSGECDDHH